MPDVTEGIEGLRNGLDVAIWKVVGDLSQNVFFGAQLKSGPNVRVEKRGIDCQFGGGSGRRLGRASINLIGTTGELNRTCLDNLQFQNLAFFLRGY